MPDVLIIDSNLIDISLTMRALRKSRMVENAVVMRDGCQVLDYLLGKGADAGRDLSRTPQLILLDIQLQTLNGLEVLKRLRTNERTRNVPVIIFTASTDEQQRADSLALGADAYLHKPADIFDFANCVDHLLHTWFPQISLAAVGDR